MYMKFFLAMLATFINQLLLYLNKDYCLDSRTEEEQEKQESKKQKIISVISRPKGSKQYKVEEVSKKEFHESKTVGRETAQVILEKGNGNENHLLTTYGARTVNRAEQVKLQLPR